MLPFAVVFSKLHTPLKYMDNDGADTSEVLPFALNLNRKLIDFICDATLLLFMCEKCSIFAFIIPPPSPLSSSITVGSETFPSHHFFLT